MADIQQIAAGCTRFLNDHGPRSVRERVQRVADSPLSLMRNDQYGNGGFVAELEREVAELLGKEAAVFMPSGTMAQQIALRIWADESGIPTVAYHPTCHLEKYEQMAYRELHHLEAILLGEEDRLFTVEDIRAIDQPVSTLLIELPQREIGGQLPSWEELQACCQAAKAKGMRLHLDGARLWECAPFYQRTYAEIAAPFDTVYVSFYKILGGLPGAMLAGPADVIAKAKVWQRRHGGNLHQQSPNAIAGKLGMDEHLPRMADYVTKAGEIADVLRTFDRVRIVPEHPPTNMMHLYFQGDTEALVQAALKIAEEDKAALFFNLRPGGMMELSVGAGALAFSKEDIRALFTKLFELAPR